MKKHLFLALAAFTMFSCNKVDPKNEEPATITYDFTIADKPSFDGATRAVKINWEDGDKIYILFDHVVPTTVEDFLILQYTSGSWTVAQQPATPPTGESGTLDALYYENPTPSITFDSDVYFDNEYNLAGYYLLMGQNDIPYTISKSKLSAEINIGFVVLRGTSSVISQWCVTELDTSVPWQFSVQSFEGSTIKSTTNTFKASYPRWDTGGFYTGSSVNVGLSTPARDLRYKNADGYLYLVCDTNTQGTSTTVFLRFYKNGAHIFSKSFNTTITKNQAITFKGPAGTVTDLAAMSSGAITTNGWTKK